MLSHVWAWLRRTLEGICNHSPSIFPFFEPFNKRVKTILIGKFLVAPLRETVEPLNAEAINRGHIPARARSCTDLRDTALLASFTFVL